jgi:hypothetical protein
VKRRRYWRGVPTLHGDCRHKAMEGKRASISGKRAGQLDRALVF